MQLCTLIFEGVDRVGKSSLISAFREVYPFFECEKMRVPKTLGQAMTWYEEYWQDIQSGRHSHKIWDRGHVSEAVYAPLYKSYTNANWPTTLWKREDHYTKQLPVIIVYVYPIWTELMCPDERPNSNITAELAAYHSVLTRNTWLPVIDITKHMTQYKLWREPKSVVAELVDRIDEVLSHKD